MKGDIEEREQEDTIVETDDPIDEKDLVHPICKCGDHSCKWDEVKHRVMEYLSTNYEEDKKEEGTFI